MVIGLRLSPEDELKGADLIEHGIGVQSKRYMPSDQDDTTEHLEDAAVTAMKVTLNDFFNDFINSCTK